jgi:branched-chain amino acid transport system substrate-binding protein
MSHWPSGVGARLVSNPMAAFAEPGESEGKIVFGQAAARGARGGSRPRCANGDSRCFCRGDRSSGVKGRFLELTSRDGGYEPAKSVEVTKMLINDDKLAEAIDQLLAALRVYFVLS